MLRIGTVTACVGVFTPLWVLAQVELPLPPEPYDVAAACEQAKKIAAAHAHPDVSNVIGDAQSPFLKDSCVAAVINPAVLHPNPSNPQSYMCVGKRARISITPAGRITDTNVPDPSTPAGKCVTTACNTLSGPLSCFGANEPTSLFAQAAKFLHSFQSFLGAPTGGGNATPVALGIRG